MLMNKETSDALDVLYNQFFNLNSLFDNAVSYMLNEWCMPNASDLIHHNLAHGFPIMADMISEIKDNYDERSIRMELPKHDESYNDLSDMMDNLLGYCNDTYEMIKQVGKVAMDNDDFNVVSDLVGFTTKFNKIIGQVITLQNKAKQMPTEYDKFDRHIDKWGIVGLE